MYIPLWLIIANVALIVVLIGRLWRSGERGDDMIAQQRRATPPPASNTPASTPAPSSTTTTSAPLDESTLMARPDIADALAKRRHIAAIRLVREATGLGLKDSKQIVDRYRR